MGCDVMESLAQKESSEMIRIAKENFEKTSSNNVWSIELGSEGEISADVFGEEGVVKVDVYESSENTGKFGLALTYPRSMDKLKEDFAQKHNIDVSEIRTNDSSFAAFVLLSVNNGWVDNKLYFSDYVRSEDEGIVYDSKQEAVNALWSDDVFACKPTYGKGTAKK